MHTDGVGPGVLQAGKPGVVIRWLALHLNRQIDRRFYRRHALGQNRRAPVRRTRRARGHDHVLNTIQFNGGFRDFRQLLRRFALNRAPGTQRLTNRTELACLAPALIADAGLQHRGRQYIAAMQSGYLLIRNSVRRAQTVKRRITGKGHIRQRNQSF